MTTTMSDEDFDGGPMIGLRSLMTTVQRRHRIWLATGLLGLIIGAVLPLAVPHQYTAVTDLYLAPTAGTNPSDAMTDNVSLLQTEVVAKEAVSTGHLHETPGALLAHYTGLPVSGTILSITFSSPSKSGAVTGAKAVAQAFLTVEARELGLQTNVVVHGLQSQIASLNSKMDNLDTLINFLSGTSSNGSTSPEQTANQLTELVDQRSSDQSQISQLQTQLQQALLNKQSASGVSHVLDPATLNQSSTSRAILEGALSGFVVGLAVGLAAVIFGALLTERAPDRAAVATALGAPVELSLPRHHSPRVMRRYRLSGQLRRPTPSVRIIEHRLRDHLEAAPGSSLAVITVGAADPAALAVGALAFDLSSEGRSVVVVDAGEGRILASALGLASKPQTMDTFEIPGGDGPAVRVVIAPEDPAQMARKPPPDDADAVLVLTSLDPAFGTDQLSPWVTDAVMILHPHGVNLTRLQVCRQMLRGAGISLRSVILLGSDPQDDSSGAFGPVERRLAPVELSESSK